MTEQQNKNIKTGGIVVAAALIVYFGFIKKNNGPGLDPTGNGTATPGQPIFNSRNVALGLYEAMKDMGTEEEAILQILTPINPAQFAKVFVSFGSLNYNSFTGDQRSYNPFYPLPKVNLKGWLKSELSVKEYAILRSKYPNHL
jgi:hypothetical protein